MLVPPKELAEGSLILNADLMAATGSALGEKVPSDLTGEPIAEAAEPARSRPRVPCSMASQKTPLLIWRTAAPSNEMRAGESDSWRAEDAMMSFWELSVCTTRCRASAALARSR